MTAANGADGLRCTEQFWPGLILLDMRMPVMDGWAFAQALRARGAAPPIVVMTAAQDARRWAQEIGATGYLAKPFELHDLIDVVQRLYTSKVIAIVGFEASTRVNTGSIRACSPLSARSSLMPFFAVRQNLHPPLPVQQSSCRSGEPGASLLQLDSIELSASASML